MEELNSQVHHVRLFRGITKPGEEFEGLREAERVVGLGWRIVVISVITAIAAGLVTYYGIHFLHVTAQTGNLPNSNPIPKGLVQGMAIGSAAFGGLFEPIVVMLIMALIFWIFFNRIGYKKLFAIELYLQFISLIGTIVSGILMIIFQSAAKSYLNLGAITQLFSGSVFINGFFGGISIFLIWKLYVQIHAYRHASVKSSRTVIWTLILLNIVFLLIIGGVSSLGQQLQHQLQHLQNLQPSM